MIQTFRINTIRGREILDSRGNPTIEVEVKLCGGAAGRASVPSGASTGAFEAVELRDSELPRYRGNGVKRAVENINDILADKLEGKNALNQVEIDTLMIREDGTANKQNWVLMQFWVHRLLWQRRQQNSSVFRCISIWADQTRVLCRFR